MDQDTYDQGMAVRRAVVGDDYVDRALSAAGDFGQPMQDLVTEYCWGAVWGRPGLDRRTRSMLNVAMLSALGRPQELETHLRGALRNGCTHQDIQEVLLQVAVYCGVPAGIDGFRIARRVIDEVSAGAPGR